MTDFADRDPTVVAVGTSVTWSTGNRYENKFPNLVHRDLTGDYPVDERYLHYSVGSGPPGDAADPTPAYYEATKSDHDVNTDHPTGDPIPPSQYRARGGAIIGLSLPAPVKFGKQDLSDRPETDGGENYLAKNANGSYYGKLDWTGKYSGDFDPNDLNRSRWLLARDIGWHWPTIPAQIDQFDFEGSTTVDVPTGNLQRFGGTPDDNPPNGDDVDLLIVDGGTNDLTLGWLNNPLNSGRRKIWQAVRHYMYDDMVGNNGKRGLLERARETFSNAVIVLLGEPVWASNRTDRRRAKRFLVDQNSNAQALPGVVEQAVDNALNFSHFQAYWLRRAVAEFNRTDTGPGVVLAPPGYGVVNGMMADWPWAFGYDPDAGKPLLGDDVTVGATNDEVTDQRVDVCRSELRAEHCVGRFSCTGDGDYTDEVDAVSCYSAPIGHPNPEGCRQYADTIVRRYKTHIHRSVRAFSDQLDSGTDSVRDSVERYGFDLAGDGLSYAASHDVVDAMRVRIDTNSGGGSGRQRGEVYLKVYPGRNGTGERFRLDTENNDNRPGGPKSRSFKNYTRPKDEYHVDPMLSRRLSGPPGNVDRGETSDVALNEEKVQTYHSGDHWSDRRLRLGHVRHAALQFRGVDPANGWDVASVDFSINGHVTRTRTFDDLDQRDLRSGGTTPPFRWQEYLLASFNHVQGTSKSDIDVAVPESGISADGGSDRVTIHADVEITNTGSRRIPSVGLQCGLRLRTGPNADFDGLDWQVRPTSDVAPGETITPTMHLETEQTGKFGGLGTGNNSVEVATFYHVGGDVGKTTTTKEVSDLP